MGLITWKEDGSITYYEPTGVDKSDHLKVNAITKIIKKLLAYMILRNIPLNVLASKYRDKSLNDIIEGMDSETVLDLL